MTCLTILSAGLRYEIGLAIDVSKIVHVAGGVPCGSRPDLRLARHCVVPMLIPGELPSADKGYRDGHTNFFTPIEHPLSEQDHKLNRKFNFYKRDTRWSISDSRTLGV
jgi:hypothetical protein